jgi:hypothetical protein
VSQNTPPDVPHRTQAYFPADYQVKATEKGLVSWEWVTEQLTKAKNYWIGSVSPEGRPHSVPTWGCWLDNRFYFGGGDQTRHMRNIMQNPYVVVHLEDGNDAVIVEGVCQRVTEPDEGLVKQVQAEYQRKYQNPEMPVMVVQPHKVFAWQGGLHTAARFTFGEKP